jgi:hypothetical protein
MWQQLPGTPAADYIEHPIQDFTPSMLGGTAANQDLALAPFDAFVSIKSTTFTVSVVSTD